MRLSKMDLSSLIAIAHSDGHLQLLLDRGEEIELLEIPAPVQAFEGLVELNEIVAEPVAFPEYEEPLALLPVSSSMAASIAYDSHEQTLQVEFKNGAVYEYFGVDEETWEDFYSADSLGSFYNEQIRGRFDCERID